jgi:hypothetical protein
MPQVKIWNDNVHTYNETFKGEKISIPPGKFIMMEYDEAIQFKGTFAPIKLDADGRPTPEGYKMIRVEEPGAKAAVKAAPMGCHRCGYKASSAKDLSEHTDLEHADDQRVQLDEVDKELEAKVTTEPGKKRGRPAKAQATVEG